jgi:predicted DNA-binding protein
MSKQITIEISDETYEFLDSKSDETETIEMVAATYLEEGINLEKTLRQ